MRIKRLDLENFGGFNKASLTFGDFTCLVGPNGIGKTTVLNAVSLLLSLLDFQDDEGPVVCTEHQWIPKVSAKQRLEQFLSKNIRLAGEPGGATSFKVAGYFEHDGRDYVVELTEKGFARNEVVEQPWWWPGITYFSRFDAELTKFQLLASEWGRFAGHYEGITGIKLIDPELYTLTSNGQKVDLAIGFYLDKGPRGRIHVRKASAGEKKIAKALSQIVTLDRPPHIALVDNLEMHVHYKRHLAMFDEVKKLFAGIQIIATTHSTVIIDRYEPKSDIIDVEEIMLNGCQPAN